MFKPMNQVFVIALSLGFLLNSSRLTAVMRDGRISTAQEKGSDDVPFALLACGILGV